MFGSPVPTVNMGGSTAKKTSCGACTTVIIMTITLTYAALKFQHLIERRNPSIITNVDSLPDDAVFNTASADGFMMAFTIADYTTGESKSDPRYIRWRARHNERADV